jgi:hypothetical protein
MPARIASPAIASAIIIVFMEMSARHDESTCFPSLRWSLPVSYSWKLRMLGNNEMIVVADCLFGLSRLCDSVTPGSDGRKLTEEAGYFQ